jgi:hypothetical protein
MVSQSEYPVPEQISEGDRFRHCIVADKNAPRRYVVNVDDLKKGGWTIQIPILDQTGHPEWESIPDLNQLRQHLVLQKQSPFGSFEGTMKGRGVRVSYVCGEDLNTVPLNVRDAIAGKKPVTGTLWIDIPKEWKQLRLVKVQPQPTEISRREFLKQAVVTAGGLALLGGGTQIIRTLMANQKMINLFDLEKNENAPLLINGRKSFEVQATAQAAQDKGWERLVDEGFPIEAINTAVGVTVNTTFETSTKSSDASGTIMFHNGFWVLIASGHQFLSGMDLRYPNCSIDLSRKLIQNEGFVSFSDKEFGVAAVYESKRYGDVGLTNDDLDLSIVVFPDEKVGNRFEGFVDRKKALRLDQIDFNDKQITTADFFGISFPGLTNYEPALIQNGTINPLDSVPKGSSRISVDNTLAWYGFSGAGVFAKKTNGVVSYIGPVVGGNDLDPYFVDNTEITQIASMGKQGFLNFITEAITDYQRKQK